MRAGRNSMVEWVRDGVGELTLKPKQPCAGDWVMLHVAHLDDTERPFTVTLKWPHDGGTQPEMLLHTTGAAEVNSIVVGPFIWPIGGALVVAGLASARASDSKWFAAMTWTCGDRGTKCDR